MNKYIGPGIARLGIVGLLFLALLPNSSYAAEDTEQWTVAETSGQAQLIEDDGTLQNIIVGGPIAAGKKIATGDDGRVVLVRGTERITVSPGSRIAIPMTQEGRYRTTILQELGTILLKVQKRPEKHFEVKTPYMAAVVKGTTFTVSVGASGAAVHVLEGAVQVADLGGRQVQMLRPGQTATRSNNGGAPVQISGVGTGKPPAGPQTMENATAGLGGVAVGRNRGQAKLNLKSASQGLVNAPGQYRKNGVSDERGKNRDVIGGLRPAGNGKSTGKSHGKGKYKAPNPKAVAAQSKKKAKP